MRTHTRSKPLAALLMLSAGITLAQDADKPLLSGPEVKDNRPALVEDSFGEMATGKARMGAMNAIPAQDLRAIMAGMNKDDADSSIRLTQEQNERIRKLMAQYAQERREWMIEHREELAELRKQAGIPEPASQGRDGRADRAGGRGGEAARKGKPESDEQNMMEPVGNSGASRVVRQRTTQGRSVDEKREPPTAAQQAAQLRLREFMQKGPSTGDLQRRIYAELSPEQQAYIDAEVLRLAEERADEREMEKFERRRGDAKPGAGGPGQAAGRVDGAGARGAAIDWDKVLPADGSVNLDALPERVRERLSQMSEADQKRAIEVIRKRMESSKRQRGD